MTSRSGPPRAFPTYVGTAFTAFYGLGAVVIAVMVYRTSLWACASAILASASAFFASVGFASDAAWRRGAFLVFGASFPLFFLVLGVTVAKPLPQDALRAFASGGVLWAVFIAIIYRRMGRGS